MEKEQALEELELHLNKWTSTEVGRRSFLKVLPFLLASCVSAPKHRYREGDNTGQAVNLTPAEERRMADSVLPSMKKEYPPLKDPMLQNYVSDLGNKIVKANNLSGAPYNYSFQVVETEQINAFALPAGPIFVTTPLLAMCESEAELAGVIGHEVGHIKSRHTAERIYKQEKAKDKSIAYLLGGGVVGGVLGYGLSRLICSPSDTACVQRTVQLGAVAGAGGGALISKFGFMANSREDELEADRIGFKSSVKAGYDKNYVGKFYSRLFEMEQQKSPNKGLFSSFTDALSTHPPSRERVIQMNQMARESSFNQGRVNSDVFDKARYRAVEIVTG